MGVSLENRRPMYIKINTMKTVSSKEVGRWARHYLKSGSRVEVDQWAAYQAVSQAGMSLQQPSIKRHPQLKDTVFIWINTMMGNVKRSMDGTLHALRLPYVARYLLGFAWRFNHRFSLRAALHTLLGATCKAAPRTRNKILA